MFSRPLDAFTPSDTQQKMFQPRQCTLTLLFAAHLAWADIHPAEPMSPPASAMDARGVVEQTFSENLPAVEGDMLAAVAAGVNVDLDRRYSPESYQAQMRYRQVGVMTVGEGVHRAYVFFPSGKPGKNGAQPYPLFADGKQGRGLPLILFHHGWLGMNPKNFGSLIDLLVRRGAVLIYPLYQDGDRTSPQDVTRIAAEADQAALAAVKSRMKGLVDETRTFYFGFSMGAAISVNIALAPDFHGLPAPKAMLLAAPGNAEHVVKGEEARSIYGRVEELPADLPTVIITGLADTSIGVPTARMLAGRMCHLKHRSLIMLPSDSDGGSKVQAGHGSPGAPDTRYDFDPKNEAPSQLPSRDGFELSISLNQLDFHGYWRYATSLMDYVAGQPLNTSLFAASAENRYLGLWPSGKAFATAHIENPCVR